jgi:hypothetical protein
MRKLFLFLFLLWSDYALAQTIDFVASKNSATATAKAVLGRTSTTGAVELRFTNLQTASYLIGSNTVHVVAERIPDNGTAALPSLTTVINADYPVVGNTITIILPTFGATEAYIVTLTAGTGGSPPSPVSTSETVTIDMSLDGGPVTYRASGFMHHGILAATPSDALVTPMKTKMVRCGALGANDVCNTIYNRVTGLGAKLQFLLSDNFYQAPWPGDGGNWTAWDNQCTNKVNAAVTAGRTFEWDIWNEPNITNPFWGAAGGQSQWFEAWKRCVNIIRGILPNAVIVGPSVGGDFTTQSKTYLEQFLTYAKANNVMPNRLSWHESWGGAQVQDNIDTMRTYMVANDINPIPISISEYVNPSEFTAPGPTIRYLATLERAQVDSAAHACWNDTGTNTGDACFNTPATLNGLLTTNGLSARSSWWVHKGYGDLSGRMVGFTAGIGLAYVLDNFESGMRIVQPKEANPNLQTNWGYSCTGCTVSVGITTPQAHDGTHSLDVLKTAGGDLQFHFYTFTESLSGWPNGWNLISKFANNPTLSPAGGTPAWPSPGQINRIRFWIKMPASMPQSNPAKHNFEFGTYIRCSTCYFAEDGGNHYYHFFDFYNAEGEWQQAIVDMHPDHQRGGFGNAEWPDNPPTTPLSIGYNYFDLMTRFYFDFPYTFVNNGDHVYIDGVEAYIEPNAENTEQIRSLTGVYIPKTNELRLGWTRRKDQELSPNFDVRYAFSDIHAMGFTSATLAATVPPNCCNGDNMTSYSTTGISVSGQSMIYMAIRPVGATLFRQIAIPIRATGGGPTGLIVSSRRRVH